MKYLILVPDGAGDEEIKELGGKTPLEVAKMPCANYLAQHGEVGTVKTIPDGISPGSDSANLSVMGYDPKKYLTGRSPLEAASMGIKMESTDVAFRTNIITLDGEGDYENLKILDHSAGDITTEEASILIEDIEKALGTERLKFYKGVSYRHCMIMKNGTINCELTPPHDILEKKVREYLPKGECSEEIIELMKKSYQILKDHPINIERIKNGLNPANTIWIWGQGTKPNLPSFKEKYGIDGTAISAVDLIKGIAKCAKLSSVDVDGATGTIHTNFHGKANAAIAEFKAGKDFVYMHLEAPDECSHQGDLEGKIKSLEYIDEKVLNPIIDFLCESEEDFAVMIVPDHKTPLHTRTHSSTPVPYVIYRSFDERSKDTNNSFSERSGEKGKYFSNGFELADYFFIDK